MQAIHWFRKAAKQEHTQAEYELGMLYYESEDYSKAVRWLKKAAKQNYVPAMEKMAECYRYGHGVKKNTSLADEWMSKIKP